MNIPMKDNTCETELHHICEEELIEHFEEQIELANDYIELAKMFKDIDILQFICVNKKVIDKLKNH